MTIEQLKVLKKKRDDFMNEFKDHPDFGLCYSGVWIGKDDILREIDRALSRFFETL